MVISYNIICTSFIVIGQGGFIHSTKLHENPAYGQQTFANSSSDRRGLDHTYESIKISRLT